VIIDAITSPPRGVDNDLFAAAINELRNGATARANDFMHMSSRSGDERLTVIRTMDALDRASFSQQLNRTIDRGQADVRGSTTQGVMQLLNGEWTPRADDGVKNRLSLPSESQAAPGKGGINVLFVKHCKPP
jgi:hypothetical protein